MNKKIKYLFTQRECKCITASSSCEAPCGPFIFNLIAYLDTQRPPSVGLIARAQASLGSGVSELPFFSRNVPTKLLQACATAPDKDCAWRPLRLSALSSLGKRGARCFSIMCPADVFAFLCVPIIIGMHLY